MNFVPRLIPSLLLVSLLTGSGALPPMDVFGIVTQARNASLSYGAVSAGASVYDGDTLATAVDGTLTLRTGSSMIHLGTRSRVTLRSAAGADQSRTIHSQRWLRDVRDFASRRNRDSCRSSRHSSCDASSLVRANYHHHSVVV